MDTLFISMVIIGFTAFIWVLSSIGLIKWKSLTDLLKPTQRITLFDRVYDAEKGMFKYLGEEGYKIKLGSEGAVDYFLLISENELKNQNRIGFVIESDSNSESVATLWGEITKNGEYDLGYFESEKQNKHYGKKIFYFAHKFALGKTSVKPPVKAKNFTITDVRHDYTLKMLTNLGYHRDSFMNRENPLDSDDYEPIEFRDDKEYNIEKTRAYYQGLLDRGMENNNFSVDAQLVEKRLNRKS